MSKTWKWSQYTQEKLKLMALSSVKVGNFIQGNQDVSNLIFKNT